MAQPENEVENLADRVKKWSPFTEAQLNLFDEHASAMAAASRARREAVTLRSIVTDDTVVAAVDIRDTLGVRQPQDRWIGCTNLRTLRTLLTFVDDRGFERCANCQSRAVVFAHTLVCFTGRHIKCDFTRHSSGV